MKAISTSRSLLLLLLLLLLPNLPRSGSQTSCSEAPEKLQCSHGAVRDGTATCTATCEEKDFGQPGTKCCITDPCPAGGQHNLWLFGVMLEVFSATLGAVSKQLIRYSGIRREAATDAAGQMASQIGGVSDYKVILFLGLICEFAVGPILDMSERHP
eukprot:SAG31_NODE_5906_length_2263_cov_1.831793_1_plen_157_part_00